MVTLTARFEEAQADGDVARKLQQGCLEYRMRPVGLLGQGHELATGTYIEAAFLPEMMWPFLHDTDDLPLSAPCYLAAYGQDVGGVSVGQHLGGGKNNGWPSGSAYPWAVSKTHALVCFSFSLVRGAMRLDPLGMADKMYEIAWEEVSGLTHPS